jgi:hypothetical protein
MLMGNFFQQKAASSFFYDWTLDGQKCFRGWDDFFMTGL